MWRQGRSWVASGGQSLVGEVDVVEPDVEPAQWYGVVPRVVATGAMSACLAQVRRVIGALRMPPQRLEAPIQAAVAAVCLASGAAVEREVVLAPRCRIDLVVTMPHETPTMAWRVGVEVKKGKPNSTKLAEQARRYFATQQLDALVLVVERSVIELDVRRAFGDGADRIAIVALSKQWGLSL